MGPYEIILTVVFLMVSVIFVLCGGKACARAAKETDHRARKDFRRKALFLMTLALMFSLCALYLVFRISWLILAVSIIGFLAAAYVIGSGVVANMREH